MTKLDRRRFLGGAAAASVSMALSCGGEPARRPPNIVFLMADELGYGELGCYGQRQIHTPHIDRIAAEGMRFTDAYAGCTVGAPSRGVLLTGLNMGHAPVRADTGVVPLLPSDVTIAELLKGRGYASGCFGEWGLGDIGSDGVPWRQGFDEFFGYLRQVHAHYYPGFLYSNEERYPLPGNENGGRATSAHDVIAERALDFIRRHREQPFFCYVPFTIPHLDPRTTLAGMVSRLDRDVGRLMALLAELNVDHDTVVFFTSDNGAVFSARDSFFNSTGGLRGHQGNFYEGGIRVPFIARWPGRIAPGSTSGLPCGSWDMLPTFLELASLDIPPNADGVSIAPTLLGDGKQRQRKFLYWELPRYRKDEGKFLDEIPRQAARHGDWKVVRPEPDGELELYNLASDRTETTNVAAANPKVMAVFKEYLKRARYKPREQTMPAHTRRESSG